MSEYCTRQCERRCGTYHPHSHSHALRWDKKDVLAVSENGDGTTDRDTTGVSVRLCLCPIKNGNVGEERERETVRKGVAQASRHRHIKR